MKITYNTVKNTKQLDKPNEDIIFCDLEKNIYILLDGVSRDNENGKYPNPSPALDTTQILVTEIYNNILLYDFKENNLSDIILNSIQKANDKVHLYNEDKNLPFDAGAVGIIAIIYNNYFYYAYIGDCFGRILYHNKIFVFTECQTKLVSQHKQEYTTYEIREVICNNIYHPCGYGVLNGDKRAINFVKTGKINLSNVEQIILTSDGMEDFISKCPINFLKSLDASKLLEAAVLNQNEKQDDRSIIKIEGVNFNK